MKAVLAFAAISMILALVPPAVAQTAPARASRISVVHVPPKNPAHQAIHNLLKEHRSLEKLQELLSPFRLPRPVMMRLEECDGEANAWYDDDVVTVCYEYIQDIWQNAPEETTPTGVAPIDAVCGPLYDVFLHELGHALFDVLDVPLLGREEEAADQVSAYIMLQLGKAEARRLIMGTAYAYQREAETSPAPVTLKQFADQHGTPAQRLFNLLCFAYGADAKLFADIVKKGYLPKERAEACDDEYQQVEHAFQKLIDPHIDQVLKKRVFKKSWLPDVSTRLARPPGSTRAPQSSLFSQKDNDLPGRSN
jgi:hypothetical protein